MISVELLHKTTTEVSAKSQITLNRVSAPSAAAQPIELPFSSSRSTHFRDEDWLFQILQICEGYIWELWVLATKSVVLVAFVDSCFELFVICSNFLNRDIFIHIEKRNDRHEIGYYSKAGS